MVTPKLVLNQGARGNACRAVPARPDDPSAAADSSLDNASSAELEAHAATCIARALHAELRAEGGNARGELPADAAFWRLQGQYWRERARVWGQLARCRRFIEALEARAGAA